MDSQGTWVHLSLSSSIGLPPDRATGSRSRPRSRREETPAERRVRSPVSIDLWGWVGHGQRQVALLKPRIETLWDWPTLGTAARPAVAPEGLGHRSPDRTVLHYNTRLDVLKYRLGRLGHRDTEQPLFFTTCKVLQF